MVGMLTVRHMDRMPYCALTQTPPCMSFVMLSITHLLSHHLWILLSMLMALHHGITTVPRAL